MVRTYPWKSNLKSPFAGIWIGLAIGLGVAAVFLTWRFRHLTLKHAKLHPATFGGAAALTEA
jgi:Na+-driven multidrug efflux pump